MSVIKACCDRVGILEAGQLIEENEVGEFFAHPKTEIAKNFIASSILQHLPTAIESKLQKMEGPETHPILRFWFFEGTATQPIISDLSLQFDVRVNILQANVEYIKNHIMGLMVVALKGHRTKILQAIEYLQQMGIKVEILGYVPDNVITYT
jgi:D-methionine transport system ATP-binding protein